MAQNNLIFLLGMPGCGKSRKGKYIADKLNWAFYDTDTLVEKAENRSIPDIFQQKGELYFREKEREILHQIINTEKHKAIIATGGGLPCFSDNMHTILQHGFSVYLVQENSTITERLFRKKTKRPLLQHLETQNEVEFWVEQTIQTRNVFYMQANKALYAEFLSLYDFLMYVQAALR